MRKIFSALLLLPLFTEAQNNFKIIIKNETTQQPMQGATLKIKKLKISLIADSMGAVILNNISNGKYDIEVTNVAVPAPKPVQPAMPGGAPQGGGQPQGKPVGH